MASSPGPESGEFSAADRRELNELAYHAARCAERQALEGEPLWIGPAIDRALSLALARRLLARLLSTGYRVSVRDGQLYVGPQRMVDTELARLLTAAREVLLEVALSVKRGQGSRPAGALHDEGKTVSGLSCEGAFSGRTNGAAKKNPAGAPASGGGSG